MKTDFLNQKESSQNIEKIINKLITKEDGETKFTL